MTPRGCRRMAVGDWVCTAILRNTGLREDILEYFLRISPRRAAGGGVAPSKINIFHQDIPKPAHKLEASTTDEDN
jgi:hypothetical protein